MSRPLLCIALLLVAFAAHAVVPSRPTADGAGSGCPPAAQASESAIEAVPATTPEATASPPSTPGSKVAVPRVTPQRTGVRWHSFLPGMFK